MANLDLEDALTADRLKSAFDYFDTVNIKVFININRTRAEELPLKSFVSILAHFVAKI